MKKLKKDFSNHRGAVVLEEGTEVVVVEDYGTEVKIQLNDGQKLVVPKCLVE